MQYRSDDDDTFGDTHGKEIIDPVKMGNIISWLGMVKRRGLTSEQIEPFLDAYQESGHLTPALAKFTHQALVHLDGVDEAIPEQVLTEDQYSDCLLQLHNIICNPGYTTSH